MINILKRTFGSRRGVAPIIATLLMVAIAVVGGVLIYVYTQGFFASTSSTTVSTDVIVIVGYDTRERDNTTTGGITNSLGSVIANCGDVEPATFAVDNQKVAGDHIAIHIRNGGGAAVTLTSVKVNGAGAPIATTDFCSDGAATKATTWNIVTSAGTALASSSTVALNPGQTTSIVFELGETLSNGQTVSVEIGTASGGSFASNIAIGQRK